MHKNVFVLMHASMHVRMDRGNSVRNICTLKEMNVKFEHVRKFSYLGKVITSGRKCNVELGRRAEIVKGFI